MVGLGTVVNVATIVAGTTTGLVIGRRLPERVRVTMLQGVGLAVVALGVRQATSTDNLVFPLVAVVLGGLVGELLGIEAGLAALGERIRRRVERPVDAEVEGATPARTACDEDDTRHGMPTRAVGAPGRGDGGQGGPDAGDGGDGRTRFVEGFVAASLLYVVGPLAILGSIADGLSGDVELLVVKAALDGLVSIVFAATLGWGVGFSVVPVALYQGAITLAAGGADAVLTDRMILELTATGGLLVMGIGVRLLDLKPIRVASFLPALVIAPVLVALFAG